MRRGKLLLVDGYNAICGGDKYQHLIEETAIENDIYAKARQALIADVALYAQYKYEAYIVFDGACHLASTLPYQVAGINIIYSGKHEADEIIEELAVSAVEAQREVVVVSSDAAIQALVFRDGITRMSSRIFSQNVSHMSQELQIYNKIARKKTISSRIDPQIAQRLSAWVKNKGQGNI